MPSIQRHTALLLQALRTLAATGSSISLPGHHFDSSDLRGCIDDLETAIVLAEEALPCLWGLLRALETAPDPVGTDDADLCAEYRLDWEWPARRLLAALSRLEGPDGTTVERPVPDHQNPLQKTWVVAVRSWFVQFCRGDVPPVEFPDTGDFRFSSWAATPRQAVRRILPPDGEFSIVALPGTEGRAFQVSSPAGHSCVFVVDENV